MLPQVHVDQGPQGQGRVLIGGADDLQAPGAAHQPHPAAAEDAGSGVFMLRCSPSMEPKLCSISASSAGEGLVVRAGAREEKYSVWL